MAEDFELHLARDLATPYEAALRVLEAGPERWLPGFAQDGDRMTARLGFDQAGRHIGRRIEVRVAPLQRFAYGVIVRLEWKGARRPRLYPRLEGHLRLERGEADRSRLRFDARYVPPAGRLGASVDRTLMSRVADVTLNDFLDRVAERLAAVGEPA
ncbi:MAG: hypothetical protein ACREQM_16525 [Candidatus Dormibacteraceae bacterium]